MSQGHPPSSELKLMRSALIPGIFASLASKWCAHRQGPGKTGRCPAGPAGNQPVSLSFVGMIICWYNTITINIYIYIYNILMFCTNQVTLPSYWTCQDIGCVWMCVATYPKFVKSGRFLYKPMEACLGHHARYRNMKGAVPKKTIDLRWIPQELIEIFLGVILTHVFWGRPRPTIESFSDISVVFALYSY